MTDTASAIAAVLAARGTPAYDTALTIQRDVLTAELQAASDRLALLDQLLDQEGHTMNAITITRRTIPARTIVALRGTIPTYSDEGMLWARLMPAMQAQGITPIGPGGCIEHDAEYRESDVDESVWLTVAPGTTAAAPLEVHDIPEQDVVVARVEGPYSLISEAHARIQEFIAEHGLTAAEEGPDAPLQNKHFNIYLNDPGSAPSEALLTEVYRPLA
ncbi:MAG: GyrI-like domain-containing protein [Dermatophilus congolensis]|nr:GyrI-like domain-containing protein [Dermatophilus congolensis]